MPVQMIGSTQALSPHDVGPNLDDYPIKILSQGDSWFSIGALPPWSTSNILMELTFSSNVAIVTCAEPGQELANMASQATNSTFISLIKGPCVTQFNAILISGGGNDMIDAVANGLLLSKANWTSNPAPQRYVSQSKLAAFATALTASFTSILTLRDAGINKNVPLYLHSYDYSTPRNAGVGFDLGPWLYPAMTTAGIPENEWVDVARYLIDQMANTYSSVSKLAPNIFLVDTRGTLVPAALNTCGVCNNWENEIHPTPSGYSRLAAVWESKLAMAPLNLS
jgi:hypothetical protein